MSLCLVSPRFFPIIGGAENYLRDIAEFCSTYIKTKIVTSDLVNSPKDLFEKYSFIKKRYDILKNEIEIIRSRTTKNLFLRSIFYTNQFTNKKLEIYFDKIINPYFYNNQNLKLKNQNVIDLFSKIFLSQRRFIEPNFIEIYYTLKKLHFQEKIKIIHSAPIYLSVNIYAYKFAKKYNIPFICTPLYHINPFTDYIFYPSYQYILRNSSAIISCTNIEKEFYSKFNVKKDNIYVIPPGIDPKNYKKDNHSKIKEKLNIDEDTPLLLFMGRKSREKGIFNSIIALKYLIKKYEKIKLLIAGPSTKEYYNFLNKASNTFKSHIIDLGIVEDDMKSDLFSSCDIFLLPSIDDAFGIVYLEAWLFKKPIIGVSGGNVEGLIDNNINGLLINFNDPRQLALKIDNLIENPEKRKELGQNGYDKLMKNYLLKITNEKILELYKKFM